MTEVDAPLVEFRDLAVSYGPVAALQGVSGVFPSGPTGLLGPNGAGKTTLLKTLLGFLRPERGSLVAFGLDPGRTAPRRAPSHRLHARGRLPRARA